MRPGFATVFTILGVPLVVVSMTRWIDFTAGGVLPALQALGPIATGAALVAALIAVGLNPKGTAPRLLAILVAVDLVTALVLMRTTAAPTASGDKDGTNLTVVSANVGMGGGDPDGLLRDAEAVDADVLVLLEADRWYVRSLDEAGALSRYPHRVISDDEAPSATAVLSRRPFEEVATPELTFASATIRVDGITVRAVHTAPPLPGLADDWAKDFTQLDTWARGTDGPVIMAGDFNASASHPAYRALCRGEAAMQDCDGVFARPTWSPASWLPDLLPLDHILVRDLDVRTAGTFEVEGSDHRAVWKRIISD